METITAAQNLTLILKQPTGSLFLSLVNIDIDFVNYELDLILDLVLTASCCLIRTP